MTAQAHDPLDAMVGARVEDVAMRFQNNRGQEIEALEARRDAARPAADVEFAIGFRRP